MPMIATDAEGSQPLAEERSTASRGRRTIVILISVVLATVACSIIGATLIRGTWWYSDPTDRPLDEDSLARLESLTRGLASSSAAAEAIAWLNAAADPNADPSAVWAYLIEAKSILAASSEPALHEAAEEVELIIQSIRTTSVITSTSWLDVADEPLSETEEPTTGD
jgi:hypothetical protein